MTNRALYLGQLIANAHPADVRLLFQQYGITAVPTGKTILDAYLVYGDPFLWKLGQIALKSQKLSFSRVTDTGLETDKLLASAQSKVDALDTSSSDGSFWNKFSNIFNGAGTVLTSVAGAWDTISGVFSGGKSVSTGTTDANTQLQAEIYKMQLEQQQSQESSQTKTYLLIGAGVLVVALVVIMYIKKK